MKQGKKSWCSWHKGHVKFCPNDCGYASHYVIQVERAIAKREKLKKKRQRSSDEKRKARTCPMCATPLLRRKQITCSRACRKKITLARRAERLALKAAKTANVAKVKHHKPVKQPHKWNCVQCGSEFETRTKNHSETCSHACKLERQKESRRKSKVPRFCRQCNIPIEHPQIVFCGPSCSNRWHSADSARKERKRAAQRKIARNEFLASLAGRQCAICHKPFNPVCETQKYCSRKCSRKIGKRKRDKRRRLSPHHVIKERLSNRLRELLSKQGKQKQNGITAYMGCTPREMMDHVESQFRDGMNWGNYGVNGWHLDHIIPCERFDLTREDHCRVCFNWRNIRPLWGKDNWTRQHMLTLDEALNIDPELAQMAKDAGVQLW